MKRTFIGGAVAAFAMTMSFTAAEAASCKPAVLNGGWIGLETMTTDDTYLCVVGLKNGALVASACSDTTKPQRTYDLRGRVTVRANCALTGILSFERPGGGLKTRVTGTINPKTGAIVLKGAEGGQMRLGRYISR